MDPLFWKRYSTCFPGQLERIRSNALRRRECGKWLFISPFLILTLTICVEPNARGSHFVRLYLQFPLVCEDIYRTLIITLSCPCWPLPELVSRSFSSTKLICSRRNYPTHLSATTSMTIRVEIAMMLHVNICCTDSFLWTRMPPRSKFTHTTLARLTLSRSNVRRFRLHFLRHMLIIFWVFFFSCTQRNPRYSSATAPQRVRTPLILRFFWFCIWFRRCEFFICAAVYTFGVFCANHSPFPRLVAPLQLRSLSLMDSALFCACGYKTVLRRLLCN